MITAASLGAKVTLPNFITENMVIQQNSTLLIPGKAVPGATVTVKTDWLGKELKANADAEGAFTFEVPTPAAGGPFTIILTDDADGEKTIVSNVLSGEVWLCSGQSNMEFSVGNVNWGSSLMNRDEVVATSQHPDIRILKVKKTASSAPKDDVDVDYGGWAEANPSTMGVSAIAYLFALQMLDELGVPVGVIDASWGGTAAEAWTAYEAVKGIEGFEKELALLEAAGFDDARIAESYNKALDSWVAKVDDQCLNFDKGTVQTGEQWGVMPLPGSWERSVLPGFDGVVWLQRELELPVSAAGKPLRLAVGVVDDRDDTYFNGVRVGGYDNPSAQRVYEVPGNLVKAGKNVITVRVIDYMGGGGVADKSEMYATVDGKTYSLAGDWNYRADCTIVQLPARPLTPYSEDFPTRLYNAMIYPLRGLPVKGVLWYQGCDNVGRAQQYEKLFKTLITNWRETFNNPDMPFYFVQLAGFLGQKNVQPDSEWALLRNSQAKALELPNTGMAVAIDLGNPVDIHPSDKQEVARRLGLIALNRDYGRSDVVYKAPVVVSSKRDGNKMVLKFDGVVKPTSSALTGFIIGDKSGQFAYANARLNGDDTVVVSSPLIDEPVAVRYDWADYPGGNLYGVTGLPVAPFATDK